MTYAEAVQFLYDLQMFGAKFGLENTRKLASLAGNPQEKLRFIHVAGTNGKGSTCAMLENIYRAAGLRVGLFTSPHLVSFAERMQVNRQLVSEANIVRLVAEIQPLLKQFPTDAHPTFFEVVTVMALTYFAEQKCDLVIWETGMGGRLDATNIVTPLASVITNIALDHQKWLGNTLTEIAAEKAGIIKPGVPVIAAVSESEAFDVIRKIARERYSPLTPVDFVDTKIPPLDDLELPLLGEHQRLNAALAIATVRALGEMGSAPASGAVVGARPTTLKTHEILDGSENPNTAKSSGEGTSRQRPGRAQSPESFKEAIRVGLSQVNWPGRLQQIKTKSGQTILLDGAHNPSGAMALRDAIAKHFPGKQMTLILGILQDKEWSSICVILASLSETVCLVPVSSERTTTPEELERAIRKANPCAKIVTFNSLAQALEATAQDSFVVITGSLYLVGEALELLQHDERTTANERGLNEWQGGLPKKQ